MQNTRRNSLFADVDWGWLLKKGLEKLHNLPDWVKLPLYAYITYKSSETVNNMVNRGCDTIDNMVDKVTEAGGSIKVSSDGFTIDTNKDRELPEPAIEGELLDEPETSPDTI